MKTDAFLLKWSYVNTVIGFALIMGMGALAKHTDGFANLLVVLVAVIGGVFALLGILYSIRRINIK